MATKTPVNGKHRLRVPRASYANVAATVALVFALGAGTAFATHHYLISSTKQIKPSVIKKLHGKAGKAGVAGPIGATGPTGIGATGPTGQINHLVQWNATVATAGASAGSPNTVPLATVGPFTITGECFISTTHTDAGTFAATSQDNAALSEYETNEDLVPFNIATGPVQVNNDDASGVTSTNTADFVGPYDGSWALSTATGSTVVNGFANQGVWLQGSSGPACSFSGYLVYQ